MPVISRELRMLPVCVKGVWRPFGIRVSDQLSLSWYALGPESLGGVSEIPWGVGSLGRSFANRALF